MTINEKLTFFVELLHCSHNIFLWSYTPDLKLLSTNCPPEVSMGEMISLADFSSAVAEYAGRGGIYPFVLDTLPGLLYIAGFEYHDNILQRIHILGPASTGKNSHILLRKELDRRNLSVRLRSVIFRYIDQIPLIPTTQFFQYAVMFHYCISGERISPEDIQFAKGNSGPVSDEIQLISGEHRGIWAAEQSLLRMFREGNPDYKKALERSSSLSSGVKFDTGDTIRQQKNSLLVLLTLCSRAAIEGGLNPSVSYTLNDYYAGMIEECRTTASLSSLARDMLDDYMQRVRRARSDNGLSPQIQSACDYITMHPRDNFRIADLAERSGYTEYYFSHKFKKETGTSVTDYIRKVKIDHAKTLLGGTHMSIQEISDELGFASRSYFSSSFQKETGISPSEYRRQNLKL